MLKVSNFQRSGVVADQPYFLPLDGVRALSVLLVMLNHLNATPPFLPHLQGYLGVDIFFVISGFLITNLLLREERAAGGIDLTAFYLRRFFRIVPIYCIVLLIYILVCQMPSLVEKWVEFKSGLPYFLTFMNEFVKEVNDGTVFSHTWSLGIEEKFYLIWPVVFFRIAKSIWYRSITIIGLFLLVLFLPFLLARSYYGLLVGCLMAVLMSSAAAPAFARFLRRIPALAILGVLVLGFILQDLNTKFIFLFSWTVFLFLSHLIVQPSWLSRFLGCPPMVWLGKRSYSMYLIHVLALNFFERLIPLTSYWRDITFLLASYALAAIGAAILYRTIEEPARKYGRELFAHRASARHAQHVDLEVGATPK